MLCAINTIQGPMERKFIPLLHTADSALFNHSFPAYFNLFKGVVRLAAMAIITSSLNHHLLLMHPTKKEF